MQIVLPFSKCDVRLLVFSNLSFFFPFAAISFLKSLFLQAALTLQPPFLPNGFSFEI